MLIATAGHVDHGKTSLVRALTGVETDRLAEEKARGITIDLGFAYWRPDGGTVIGFVDVPGHERFVRNMVAGLGGVPCALLVIAADDGIMPQTLEHLRILELLGIGQGIVALTKCDNAEPGRIAAVEQEVRCLIAQTSLAGAPLMRVSARTGEGVAALAQALRELADKPRPTAGGAFRMAIDKCFSVPGTGTVASGTVLSGSISAGDHLVLAPLGRSVRVRGIQSAGEGVESVVAGQRCAVNLAGLEVEEVHRGDWLVPPAQAQPTSRIEVLVRLAPEREAPLRHDSRVHLHLGAAAIPARVLLKRQSPVLPGSEGAAVLVLDHPTLAINGKRFVLRDQSGRELVGGGQVLDPFPPLRRPRGHDREAVIAALRTFDARAALARLAGLETDRGWFERSFNLTGDDAQALYAATEVETAGRNQSTLAGSEYLAAGRETIIAAIAAHHGEHPESGGITLRELRQRLAPMPSAELLASQVRRLIDDGRMAQSGALLRLPQHSPTFSAAENALWRDLLATYAEQKPQQITLAEAATALRSSEGAVRTLLYRRRQNGDLWAIDEGRFMLREHVAVLSACVARLAGEHPEGFSAAQFRDASGIGRNLVIRVLEFFDRIGMTGRRGEVRILRPDHRTLVDAVDGADA